MPLGSAALRFRQIRWALPYGRVCRNFALTCSLRGFDWVIYLDNRAILRHSPMAIIHAITTGLSAPMAGRYLFRHSKRSCAWHEAKKCLRSGLMTQDEYDRIISLFQEAGYPRGNGLYENPLLVQRMGSAAMDRLNEEWYASLSVYTRRDQVLLPFLLWRNAAEFHVVEKSNTDFIKWPVITGRDRLAFRNQTTGFPEQTP